MTQARLTLQKRCFVLLALLLALVAAAPAYALIYNTPAGPVPCPHDQGFTFLVVTCLQAAIEDATYRMLAEFSDIMWAPICALITLQISLFGVQAVMGVDEIPKRMYALIIKIGCVLLFADNLGGFAPDVFDIMTEAQALVINTIGYTDDIECDVTAAAASVFFNSAIWMKMDCVLNKLFQFEEPLMMYNAIFSIISAALFSGSVGVMVFFMGITMLLNVLGYVFFAVYMFVVSYLYVGFLIVISPLLIPMLLVGVSAAMYQRWLYNLVAGIAIPVFIFAYLAITLPVLNFSIFHANGSLEEVLGDDYSRWYRNEQQWCSQQVGTDPDNYRNVPNYGYDYINGPLRNILSPILSGNTDMCAMFGTSSLDFLEEHVPMLMKILDAVIRILITAYLLTTLLKQMPGVAAAIFGGGFGLRMIAAEGLPFSSAMKGGMQEARSSMTGTVNKLGGTQGFFSQGLPGAAKGVSGIFK